MVLLAASICTRGAVISRQFREMPRSRVEALLASFPKLVSAGSQHTTVETDAVRYVYQPLEDLYMILITNKNSNILQDIETLHLFARTVADMCRSCDERDILRNSFELLGAFDEIVSLGYRENVSLAQIRSILEMESHEEKIQEIIERNKEMEAKEELKRRAKQLEMQRREAARRGGAGGFSGHSGGFSANSGGFSTPIQSAPVVRDTGAAPAAPTAKPFKSKGMQLGKKSKNADLLGAMGNDAAVSTADNVASAQALLPEHHAGAAAPVSTRATPATVDPLELLPPVTQESVHLVIKERVSMEATRDGSLASLELNGNLELRITDPSLAKLRLQIAPASAAALVPSDTLTYKTHPHVDKKAWADTRVIALRDAAKPFPVRQNLGVLRWRVTTKDETAVPLSINCWPSPAGDGSGACDVTIEYELEATSLAPLQHVTLNIPLPDDVQPANVEAPVGEWEVVELDGQATLQWRLDEINEDNASGQLEFSVTEGAEDVGVFFPVRVDFVTQKTLADVEVDTIVSAESGAPVTFSTQSVLSAENYLIA